MKHFSWKMDSKVFSSDTEAYLERTPVTLPEKIAHFLHSSTCHVLGINNEHFDCLFLVDCNCLGSCWLCVCADRADIRWKTWYIRRVLRPDAFLFRAVAQATPLGACDACYTHMQYHRALPFHGWSHPQGHLHARTFLHSQDRNDWRNYCATVMDTRPNHAQSR